MLDYYAQRVESPEVYFSKEDALSIHYSDIHNLINIAKKLPRKRARFCLHNSPDETVHEMLIVHPKGAYIRPHKHFNKPESFIVIDGRVDYFIFNDNGKIKESISMGDFRSGKPFYKSLRSDSFHSLIIYSEWLVFLEVTKGPFVKEDTVFAEWSPIENEKEEVVKFMKKLKKHTND